MQLKNSYYWFKSAISPENCQKIIDLGLSTIQENKQKGLTTSAQTMGDNDKLSVSEKTDKPIAQAGLSIEELQNSGISKEDITKNAYVRDSEIAWLEQPWLYDLITPFAQEANMKAGWEYETSYNESLQFTVYNEGGFYGWHTDGSSDHPGKYKRFIPGITQFNEKGKIPWGYTKDYNYVGKIRKISMTINLNPPGEYEGGELEFDFGPHATENRFFICDEIKPQGSIIIFPSFIHHQVKPVTRGTRYSLVMWQLGNPFK